MPELIIISKRVYSHLAQEINLLFHRQLYGIGSFGGIRNHKIMVEIPDGCTSDHIALPDSCPEMPRGIADSASFRTHIHHMSQLHRIVGFIIIQSEGEKNDRVFVLRCK